MNKTNYQAPRMREIEFASKRGICQIGSLDSGGLDNFGSNEYSDDFAPKFLSFLAAGLVLFAASCSKAAVEPSESLQPQGKELTVTAGIAGYGDTKVSYAFESDARADIKSEWVEGDTVIGFDNLGNKFKFTVKSVSERGDAVFDAGGYQGAESATLYVAYCPGKEPEDFISDGKGGYSLDPGDGYFSTQTGMLGGGFKALMCATGVVAGGRVHLDFKNQTAIVGLYRMQITQCGTPVRPGTHIRNVTLDNVCTRGTLCVKDGILQLCPYGEETGTISADVDLVTAEGGFIEVDPSDTDTFVPYFAVIPGFCEASLSVTDAGGAIYKNLSAIPSRELLPGRYYYLGKVMDNTVATVGAVRYPSLQAAVDAAGTLETITLVSEDEEICSIPKGKDITLDLAGRTIRGSISVSGRLTVKDDTGKGRIVNDGNCITVNQNGLLILEGGTIEGKNNNDSYTYATVVVGTQTDEFDSTNAIFNGGRLIQNGTTKYGALYVARATASFPSTSSTCLFSARCAAYIAYKARLTVAGGSFSWKSGEKFCGTYMNPVLSVTGGFFSNPVTDVSSGYECVENDDEVFRYKVVSD